MTVGKREALAFRDQKAQRSVQLFDIHRGQMHGRIGSLLVRLQLHDVLDDLAKQQDLILRSSLHQDFHDWDELLHLSLRSVQRGQSASGLRQRRSRLHSTE